MGLLRSNACLEWKEIETLKDVIKHKGITQFINVYKYYHTSTNKESIWGDEIELIVLSNDKCRNLKVDLTSVFKEFDDNKMDLNVEFAAYMIEMTPKNVHSSKLYELINIEKCMAYRIQRLSEVLVKINGLPLLMTCYPKLGRYVCFDEKMQFELTMSKYFPDNAITNHQRFYSFVKNIRKRRNKIVEGYIPIMKNVVDEKMLKGNVHNIMNLADDCVRIDCMGQGMGCCCLQLTIQGSTMKEARILYDMLGALCPLFLRLTRATPMCQGKLLATETRWDMLVYSVDCRTDEERGCKYIISGSKSNPSCKSTIKKSRFSSIDMYISEEENNLAYYNDLNPPLYKDGYNILKQNNVDELMAQHISSLFIRDPVLVYKSEEYDKNDEKIIECAEIIENTTENENHSATHPIFYTDDFENIQSSNWRSMRFKLPSQDVKESERGWKVEVRPMEILPTAFENASWCIFVVLISRSIIEFKANFYIPLSLVDENFRRANLLYNNADEYLHKVPEDKAIFYYRKNIFDNNEAKIAEGTVREIFLGTEDYEGIFNMVLRYVRTQKCEQLLHTHLEFVKERLEGKLLSVSDFIRRFVIRHEMYKHDSDVPEIVIDDLVNEVMKATDENNVKYLRNV